MAAGAEQLFVGSRLPQGAPKDGSLGDALCWVWPLGTIVTRRSILETAGSASNGNSC